MEGPEEGDQCVRDGDVMRVNELGKDRRVMEALKLTSKLTRVSRADVYIYIYLLIHMAR